MPLVDQLLHARQGALLAAMQLAAVLVGLVEKVRLLEPKRVAALAALAGIQVREVEAEALARRQVLALVEVEAGVLEILAVTLTLAEAVGVV